MVTRGNNIFSLLLIEVSTTIGVTSVYRNGHLMVLLFKMAVYDKRSTYIKRPL